MGFDVDPGQVQDIIEKSGGFYNNVMENGIFGQGGGRSIADNAMRASVIRSRQRARGVARNARRRLGPRSGAGFRLALQAGQENLSSQYFNTLAQAEQQNAMSKFQGAAGGLDVAKILSSLYEQDQSGGLLSKISGGLGLLAGIPGVDGLLDNLFTKNNVAEGDAEYV